MTFRDYQEQARRTQNPDLTPREMLEHALWGLSAEVGEVSSLHQKIHQGHALDASALRKEIGDVMWMIAELCDAYGFDMGRIAEENIAKLRKRYKDGFSVEASINRKEYQMLTTYNLRDGSHVTGDTDEIELMYTDGKALSETEWQKVVKAVKAGRIVINMAHVVSMRKPLEAELDRYRAIGY